MKRISLLAFVAFILINCSGSKGESGSVEEGVLITGSVGYPQENGLILIEQAGVSDFTPVDTIQLKEDYTFSHRFSGAPGFYKLNFYNKQNIIVVLDKSDIVVKVDGNSAGGFNEITGSKELEFTKEINAYLGRFQSSTNVQEINSKFMEAQRANDHGAMDKLREEYMALEKGVYDSISMVLERDQANFSMLQIVRMLDKDDFFATYEKVADKMSLAYPDNVHVKEFATTVKNQKKLAIGQMAPDIALPNPDGKVISLSSFKGNYVLVDFWAKWCGPCRKENPNVVKVYNKYHPKGFEVLGVSLDRKKEDWLRAIEEDGLVWTQISDLKYWQSEAARIYNVNAIPFALLLDPEGKIIAKNLRGAALERKLKEIYGF